MVAVALVGMLLAAFMAVRIGRSGVFQLDQFQKAMAGHSGDQLTGSAGMEWRRQFRCANIGIGHGSLVGVALNPGKRSSPSWLGALASYAAPLDCLIVGNVPKSARSCW